MKTLQPSINEKDNTQKINSLSKLIVNTERNENMNERKSEKLTLKNNFNNNS